MVVWRDEEEVEERCERKIIVERLKEATEKNLHSHI